MVIFYSGLKTSQKPTDDIQLAAFRNLTLKIYKGLARTWPPVFPLALRIKMSKVWIVYVSRDQLNRMLRWRVHLLS